MDPSTSMANVQNPESQENLEDPVMMERNQSITSEEPSHADTETTPHCPSVTPKYYSVMEDECPDEVFMQPPSPEEGSTYQAAATSVSLGSSDGTEANANPECLDWPHEEKQLMTRRNQETKEMESVLSTFEEVVRSNSLSGMQCIGQDQEVLEDKFKIQESCHSTEEEVEECIYDGIPKDPMLNEEVKSLEDTDVLDDIGLKPQSQNTERLNLVSHIESEDIQNTMEVTFKQSPESTQEEGIDGKLEDALDNELTGYDWVRRTGVEDDEEALSGEHIGLDEQEESAGTISDSRIATEILQGENLLQRLQLLQQRQDLDELYSQTPKLEEDMMTKVNLEPDSPQDIQQEEQSEQEHQTGSPLSTVKAQFEDCSIHKTEVVTDNEESVSRHFVNLNITSADEDVCKQLDQDVPVNQTVGIVQLTKECLLEDGCYMVDEKVDEEHICVEERNYSNNEDDEQEPIGRTSFPQQTDDADDDYNDRSNTSKDENRIPSPLCHRFSAAETNSEKQFQESSQMKQDLLRAEGVFDLTENSDVLEIPFKTNISLEPLSTSEDLSLRGEWHFSEQKMQKEISQEMQRELVLVNLGKIPGGYSKGESRQMKDTKLLFEAFQQEKMEGPTRIRKPLASQPKSQVYPSVLERTRSLEMFSQKMSPMFRTNSFRLVSTSEKEKYPETFRPLSPSIRDKTRLSPYTKHEKHTRMHKSMDSINMNSPTATGVRSSMQEASREGSPLLMENPFFKLRPALSLQPEVEKDIREAKKREEELRKQRSSLYGETRAGSNNEGRHTTDLKADLTQKTTGRLERVWPPPSKKDPTKPEQQEAKVQRGPGHRAALWQRWESGLINGQSPTTSNNNNNNN